MTSLIADDAMLARLCQVTGLTEIRDASGKVIGYYTPANLAQPHAGTKGAFALDLAEIERRKQSQEKGHTTCEVFEHLKAVTTDEKMRDYLQKKIEGFTERDQCASP